jgi:hypothetical protein
MIFKKSAEQNLHCQKVILGVIFDIYILSVYDV